MTSESDVKIFRVREFGEPQFDYKAHCLWLCVCVYMEALLGLYLFGYWYLMCHKEWTIFTRWILGIGPKKETPMPLQHTCPHALHCSTGNNKETRIHIDDYFLA